MLERRNNAKGGSQTAYTILVTAKPNKMMQVYVNAPGRKNRMIGAPIKVARSAFPSVVFQ